MLICVKHVNSTSEREWEPCTSLLQPHHIACKEHHKRKTTDKAWRKRRWCSLQYITKTITYSLKSVCSQLTLTFVWKTSLEVFFFNLSQNFRVFNSPALSQLLYSVITRQAGKWDWEMPCVFFYVSSLSHILLVLYN